MVEFSRIDKRRYLLDVRGYVCPYPVIYARKALSQIGEGDVLEIVTDNPPSCENVPRAMRDDGHDVLSVDNVGRGVWRIVVVKRGR
ncbi:MAG: sulfurtransferase TusA family protein [Ignisphaera sp.]|uniref:Sulfurtransferase TusA family protein n=1 Tax=Ignisphaera aggregans TaxID=334771 RepID=A0A7J3JP72_9CREN